MKHDVDSTIGSAPVRRRTVVQGAAWAVPAVMVATATPAFAVSPVPPGGLNGWVELQRNCNGPGTNFTIDGRGSYPDRGIWVFVSPAGPEPTNAEIVFYFQNNSLTFTNNSQSGWSNLTRATSLDGTAPAAGYYAYQTTYTGAWTYTTSGEDRWVANSDPKFSTLYSPNRCVNISAYARRTVTTSLGTVSFLRGPVSV